MSRAFLNNLSERRIKTRHSAPQLRVTVKPTGVLSWFRVTECVKCIDINRYGMAIETTHHYREGDKIVAGFKGKYISQSNVCGIVSSVQELSNGQFRVSIIFSYSVCAKSYSRKIDNALSRIEGICREKYHHIEPGNSHGHAANS